MRLLLTITLCALSFSFLAQSIDTANTPVWAEMMQDPGANFFETQAAFETYFESRDRQPGDGWKVFKRWEWFWSTRVNEDGSFPSADATKIAYRDWRTAYLQSQSNGAESTTGNWVEIGPIAKPTNGTGQPNGNGRLNAIAFDPTDTNTFWVGAPAGGLWKTSDGGSSWSSNTDFMATLGVSSILIHPTNTDIMYMGSGDRDGGDAPGLGVYKSINQGQSWFISNIGMGNRTVGAMVMHPANADYILAATSGGVYRSQNAGASWTNEQSGNFKDIRFHPTNPSIVYATSNGDFFRSSNGGDTWTQINSGLPGSPQRSAIGVSAADPDVVYLLVSISSEFEGLYKSSNTGTSFTQQSSSPNILGWAENGSSSGGQGWYDLCIAVDPNDASIVYAGGVNIWKSTDNGVNWDCAAHWVGSSTAAAVHADQHWLEFSPYTGALYVCNDGGIYKTHDDGVTWPELSSGLGIAQLYRLGVSGQTDEFVINGYQDNGTAIWDNGSFRTERGGDGMECLIDYSDDNVIYATVYYGNITRSTNAGYSFGGFAANGTNGITEAGGWVTPFILDHHDPNKMIIGYKNVWVTTNAKAGTPTFTQASNNLGGVNNNNIRQVKQSFADLDRVYVIRSNNTCFRTDDIYATAPTWYDMTNNLPGSGTVRDLATHPTLPSTVWLLRNNIVYRSDNAGASWYSVNGSLPSITKNCLRADPLSHEGLYLGTDAGIYYIDSTLTNWQAFDDSLPSNVEVTELEIYHPQGNWDASKIRAATYGRGLWESPLYDPENIAPLAFFQTSISEVDLCGTDTIALINNSAYGATSATWTIAPSTGFSYVGGTSASSLQPMLLFSQAGTYSITLVSSNGFGSDTATMSNAITVNPGQTITWTDDFESDFGCSTNNCALSCNIVNWNNLENGVVDDIDFRINSGTTPSSSTGPSTDFDPGTSTGNYAYTEASFCFNQEALLESPCIFVQPSTNPEFKWAYHMNGGSMGSLNLDVLSNGTWVNLETISGNQGNNWLQDSVNISAYIGQSVKFRFRAETGAAYTSDIAIDAINLTAAPLSDFAASDTTPCVGSIVTLSDSSNLNPISWSWSIFPNTATFVNGTSQNSQHPQLQFSNPGPYTITLQTTNVYGADFESKSAYIQVQQPNPILSSSAPGNAFCPESSAEVTASPGFSNYSYFVNGVNVSSTNSNTNSFSNLANNSSVYVVVEDSNGCSNQSNTLLITLLDGPVADLSSSDEDLTICDGDTVTFELQDQGIASFEFLLNGSSQQSGTASTWNFDQLAAMDAVSGIVTDTNGCIDSSNAISHTVNPIPPTPSISLAMDSLESSIQGSQYQWSFDDSLSITFNQREAKQGDGNYKVKVLENGCWSDWSSPFIITGLEEGMPMNVRLYPSPTRGEINIEISGRNTDGGIIHVIDLNGRVVKRFESVQWTEGKTSLNIASLASGIYQLSIEMGDERFTIQVVKEN